MSLDDFFQEQPISQSASVLRQQQKRDSLRFFSWLSFGMLTACFSLVCGFVYGDSYGRQHAQLNNPGLRQHYAGQCYAYWENHFKQTVRVALDRPSPRSLEQTEKLNELRGLLLDMQQNLAEIAAQKDSRPKKKLARHVDP